LYSGYLSSVCGIFAYRLVYFAGYDALKGLMKYLDRRAPATDQLQPKTGSSALGGFFIGFLCTNLAGAASYPFDTVRRVLMMQSGKAVKKFHGFADV
jgi:solute carrier family 25 (adenine nucleotide translocator) protein 4/5/6/31